MVIATCIPKTTWKNSIFVLGVCVAQVMGGATAALAEPLELGFFPPQIEPARICESRPPDPQTIALWGDWDGERLPDVSVASVRRDISRLKQLDPVRWLPTIELMISRLEEAEPRFAGVNALMARISAMEAAGEFEALSRQQLVAELANDSASLSPRAKNVLSRYYRDGIGIERDADLADALLIQAAYGGNADALLALTKLELADQGLEDWEVPTDLAVTMAFGALVGELDPNICDRASRIAREYTSGEIVQRDPQLAHDWFRFAADLGDSNAAWKVVEFHVRAEGFEKDNELLLHYLVQAADAQLPYAQIELGRMYEAGSLVEQDLDVALSYYRAAARTGERPGLTRVVIFLEEYADLYPALQEERLSMLTQLSELDNASGWVFTRLAEEVYHQKGRWAGREEAIAYLERASALGDLDGSVELARGLIAQDDSLENFERSVDILSNSVTLQGGVTSTKLLFEAFMCWAPDGPRIREANYWNRTEEATATRNVEISARGLFDLSPQSDPLVVAQLQSHALYGRPRALANYLKFLEVSPAYDDKTLAFWQEYSNQYSDVVAATARLDIELAKDPQERSLAIDLLRQQYADAGGSAALLLAQTLLQYAQDTELNVDEVRALLDGPARQGRGAALSLLATLDAVDQRGRAVYERYADVIDAKGDFQALLFAVPFVDDTTRATYLSRAGGIVPCDYKNVIAMAQVYDEIGDVDGVRHWLSIAEQLTRDNAWALTDLARSRMGYLGSGEATEALALYDQAIESGDPTAKTDMFELLVATALPTYDAPRAAQMISQAVTLDQPELLQRLLGRYRSADPAAKEVIDAELDMPSIYRVAAETGDIFSMRAYAVYLRDVASTPDDLTASTQWFERAAQGGDVTAMAEYGYALAFGIGTKADLERAIIWLEQAAEAGSEKASTITALLNLTEDS